MICFNADERNSTDLAERDLINFRDRIVLFFPPRSTLSGYDLGLFESMEEEEKQLELVSADRGYLRCSCKRVLICGN
jgi:hypothetical protein